MAGERPDWVVNPIKYDRALMEVQKRVANKELKEVTEEEVKKVYVRLAGLLLPEAPAHIQEQENLPETRKKKGKK